MLKIATWNVNSLNIRLTHVLKFLQDTSMDILCLQETKMIDAKFPIQSFKNIGYNAIFMGQPTYNGVAIIYKNNAGIDLDLDNIQYNIPNFIDEQKRVLKINITHAQQTYSIINAYFPNGQDLDSEKFIYKMLWLKALWAYINNNDNKTSINKDNLIVLGDYNITFDVHDLYDSSMDGGIFASIQERHFFTQLASLDMVDAYRYLNPQKYMYTWWDYRMNSFKRNMGLRIDHIWVGSNVVPKLQVCEIHRNMRELERPSDHAPLSIIIGAGI